MTDTTPLWIIGGFLGSGKTTVLNRLLRSFAPDAVGVLVNDFGSVGVDAGLVEAGTDVQVIELNGGQIFCSCISGSFVERLVELSATPATAILVESSGMAKPGAMGSILDEVARRTDGALQYAGMITVVDAPRFSRLRHVVNAVDEQVAYADLVVINKCDETDPATVAAVREAVTSIGAASSAGGASRTGGAVIRETSWGDLTREELPQPATPVGSASGGPPAEMYRGWGGAKPRCRTWSPITRPTPAQLEELVTEWMTAGALRIKGTIETTDGPRHVNAVPDNVAIAAPPPDHSVTTEVANALVIFEPAPGERGPTLIPRAGTVPIADGETCE